MNKSNCGAKVKIWDPKTPGYLLQMLSTDPFQSLKDWRLWCWWKVKDGDGHFDVQTCLYSHVKYEEINPEFIFYTSKSRYVWIVLLMSAVTVGPLMLMTDCCCYWVSIAAALLAGCWLLVVGFLVITFLGSSWFQEATHKPSWATSVTSSLHQQAEIQTYSFWLSCRKVPGVLVNKGTTSQQLHLNRLESP